MGKIEKSLILDPYIRRRKSNQNTEIFEKNKKRETLRRVSDLLQLHKTFLYLPTRYLTQDHELFCEKNKKFF